MLKDSLQKKCSKCQIKKSLDSFWKRSDRKSGILSKCKDCMKSYRDSKKEYYKQYYKTEKQKKYFKQYRESHKAEKAARERNNYRTNILNRLKQNSRTRLRIALKTFKTCKSSSLLGCKVETLKSYLESKFQPGMTWENYGFRGWHIDHIIPLASACSKEEVEKLCHYTNLQPLWAADNLSKGAKI